MSAAVSFIKVENLVPANQTKKYATLENNYTSKQGRIPKVATALVLFGATLSTPGITIDRQGLEKQPLPVIINGSLTYTKGTSNVYGFTTEIPEAIKMNGVRRGIPTQKIAFGLQYANKLPSRLRVDFTENMEIKPDKKHIHGHKINIGLEYAGQLPKRPRI